MGGVIVLMHVSSRAFHRAFVLVRVSGHAIPSRDYLKVMERRQQPHVATHPEPVLRFLSGGTAPGIVV